MDVHLTDLNLFLILIKKLITSWIKLDGSIQEFDNVNQAIEEISKYEPKLQNSIKLMSMGPKDYMLYEINSVGYTIQELNHNFCCWTNSLSQYCSSDIKVYKTTYKRNVDK